MLDFDDNKLLLLFDIFQAKIYEASHFYMQLFAFVDFLCHNWYEVTICQLKIERVI